MRCPGASTDVASEEDEEDTGKVMWGKLKVSGVGLITAKEKQISVNSIVFASAKTYHDDCWLSDACAKVRETKFSKLHREM